MNIDAKVLEALGTLERPDWQQAHAIVQQHETRYEPGCSGSGSGAGAAAAPQSDDGVAEEGLIFSRHNDVTSAARASCSASSGSDTFG